MKIVIVGPTGVGKTKLSVELAKVFDAYVINSDAVQIYQELNIGSAKVTEEEKEGIKHFLFDIKRPDELYTVKDYQSDARNILNKYQDKNLIVVGGTGLYVTSLFYDYRFGLDNDENYDNISKEELYKLVLKKDPNCSIDKNNTVRLKRFLKRKSNEYVEPKLLYNDVFFIGLTTPRDNLYDIINKRVDKMFLDGLVEEVKTLYQKYPESSILKRAIGYKEIIAFLNGEISLEEAKELIKKNSRHYAKRQYTWFNNKMNIKWFNVDYDNFNNTIKEVLNYISVVRNNGK
ncbi:tRNA (adenosine(37)-N6)-dimethylallyltransferase MiaA [bacterium]|nr:tRNA (adenosine(37)-N6)-dimethylallyltransferase MiaA [bacterium]